MRANIYILCILAVSLFSTAALAQNNIKGQVFDKDTKAALPGVAVHTDSGLWCVSDSTGNFSITINKEGKVKTLIFYSLGYKTLKTNIKLDGNYFLEVEPLSISDVIITATESRGLTASTKIKEDAIKHIQPSSIADLLELLPGGRAIDPAFGAPQIINLRAAGSIKNNYGTSSLGTSFIIDGKPVGNDANLQYTPAYSNLGSNHVNLGTDMRTITTEDIESVDIIRGIASVENGELTSGLIKITRRKGGKDTRARFKADMKSKLFYLGKGFEWGERNKFTMNLSGNFLDYHSDTRFPRQNYKRLTGSYRIGWRGDNGDAFLKTFNANLDYTGSFDKNKSDANLDFGDFGPIETYRSSYNKLSFGADFSLLSKKNKSFFRAFSADFSLTYENDLIDRWRFVSLGTETPLSTSLEPGEHDAISVPARYGASLKVIGKPFYAHIRTAADFKAGKHKLKAGAEWDMDKNYGEGSVFNPLLPFSTKMSVRPRAFSAIPATHKLSFFVEDNASYSLGQYILEYRVGVRCVSMLNTGEAYKINRKVFPDPRFNIRLDMPSKMLKGKRLEYGIFGGIGQHTKLPTMEMLHPEPLYGDKVQLNYWPVEPELRRINLLVYKIDPTNYDLSAAKNTKAEIGMDAFWNNFSFSVNYFLENMSDGFRNSSKYMRVVYKDYDETFIKKSELTGPPSLDGLPFTEEVSLTSYSINTNGSRTFKQGVEFSFSTGRIKAINTKIHINGAWFLTKYMNSQPEYYHPSVVIDSKPYPYIGIYKKTDGSLYDSFNTNFLFDTQIPKWGLIFSTSFQFLWFSGRQTLPDDKYPIAYLDKDLKRHDFDISKAGGILDHLVRNYTPSVFQYTRVPFSLNINLKVMKKLYHDKVACSLFVNKILDITPDYKEGDVIIRRSVLPYFGMELSFKL